MKFGAFGFGRDVALRGLAVSSVLGLAAQSQAAMVLHLDASDVDGDGNTDVVGGAVGDWIDKSGNGNDVTQNNVNARPTQVLNQLNGLPVVRFDGMNDWLFRGDALGFSGNPAMTVFAVLTDINTTGDRRFMQLGSSALANAGAVAGFSTDTSWRFNNGRTNFDATPLQDGQTNIGVYANAAGATYADHDFYFNSPTAQASTGGSNGTTNPNYTDELLSLGSWAFGNEFPNSNWIAGDFAEIIIYDEELSVSEINAIGFGLQEQWGVSNGTFVPEPATAGLLALSGLVFLRRRKAAAK